MTEVRLLLAIRHVFIVVGSSIFMTAAAAAISPLNLLGIAPHDVTYYNSGSIIWCKDRSKSFSVDRLNDDFCDCPDATDEPGTSACANGRFFCKNQKQLPLWVFSSRVNDGICDCCDGSDEYDGRVQCEAACLVDTGDVLIRTLPRKEAAWEFSVKQETDRPTKPKYLKMLVLLEIVLVMIALRQFYVWTCRGGSRLRRGLPR